VAIQPRFGVHGPQRFLGGEQEHPERIRVKLAQLVQGHKRGLQVIILIWQRIRSSAKVTMFAAEVRNRDCVYIIGQLSRGVNDLNGVREL
jgi:hypothetical protein